MPIIRKILKIIAFSLILTIIVSFVCLYTTNGTFPNTTPFGSSGLEILGTMLLMWFVTIFVIGIGLLLLPWAIFSSLSFIISVYLFQLNLNIAYLTALMIGFLTLIYAFFILRKEIGVMPSEG